MLGMHDTDGEAGMARKKAENPNTLPLDEVRAALLERNRPKPKDLAVSTPGTDDRIEDYERRAALGQRLFSSDDTDLLDDYQSPAWERQRNGHDLLTGVRKDRKREVTDLYRILSARAFSFRVTYLRKRAGYSKRELARLAGISPASICFYESGKMQPTAGKLSSLARVLDVPIGLLVAESQSV